MADVESPGGRDLGLPFKLAPRSFNLVLTTKGEKETEGTRGGRGQIRKCIFNLSCHHESGS